MAWVTGPTNKLVLHFSDYNGKRALSSYHIDSTEVNPAAGAAAAIANAAQELSNAELTQQEIIIQATNATPGTPTVGPYARGADKMQLVLRTATGVPVTLQIGAPNENTLKPDHINVDPAATNVAALINQLILHATDADGSAITGLQRGFRRRPPRRKHK